MTGPPGALSPSYRRRRRSVPPRPAAPTGLRVPRGSALVALPIRGREHGPLLSLRGPRWRDGRGMPCRRHRAGTGEPGAQSRARALPPVSGTGPHRPPASTGRNGAPRRSGVSSSRADSCRPHGHAGWYTVRTSGDRARARRAVDRRDDAHTRSHRARQRKRTSCDFATKVERSAIAGRSRAP